MKFQKEIELFLQKKSLLPKVIVIYGPTASGKTSLSIEVAQYLKSEIISTDSRQIYKYLDIGTGKILPSQMQGIPHHMIDILTPDETYSVWDFQKRVFTIIDLLHTQGKVPILAGWTGLYIDSLLYDFELSNIPQDLQLRNDLEKELAQKWWAYMYQKLQEIDREYAQELHPHNLSYVIRALEVKLITWKSKKEFRTEKKLKYETLFLTPYDGRREVLYQNINMRVEEMFHQGLVEECKNLLQMGYHRQHPGLKTIGYSEVFDYLEGKYTLQECLEKAKQANRNYAKRQLTWFRKYI